MMSATHSADCADSPCQSMLWYGIARSVSLHASFLVNRRYRFSEVSLAAVVRYAVPMVVICVLFLGGGRGRVGEVEGQRYSPRRIVQAEGALACPRSHILLEDDMPSHFAAFTVVCFLSCMVERKPCGR
ncbi:hypothetical protein B0T22DRAFT_136968 [Podospora appendiculata]|uniref:Uncharacterized protein n=1 Tax=Podospora appendiculata TaxID=314037 RepID=A0AAE0X8B2_9PEZI|nr:hypothetical protein B0T22DRAFT_136968 [Podospora appendiculata]